MILVLLGLHEILLLFSTQLQFSSNYTSTVDLEQPSSLMKTIIWFTKQTKIPKKFGTFLEKYPWWSPVLKKSHGNITEAGHRHCHFLEHFQFFTKNSVCRAHGICDAFLVFDRKVLLCGVSEPAVNRNSEEH